MPTDTNVPGDENGPSTPSSGPSAAGTPAARTPAAPTWWETISPAYMPAGAWTPDSPSSLQLTAPSSSGWMPPPSSFRSLAHGSSLPTAGQEPGEAMKAAAAAAATVAGDAIQAAHNTSDVTLASAESTARSVADEAGASARSAGSVDPVTASSFREAVADADRDGAAALVAAERARVLDVMTQARGSLGSRLQAARPSAPRAVAPGLDRAAASPPSGPAGLPAPSGSVAIGGYPGAVRPYDEGAIRSAVTGAVADVAAPYRGVISDDRLASARTALTGVVDPKREASIRRQTGILIGIAIALGAIMVFCVLGGDFDAGPDESGWFAVGILLTAVAQVILLIWAVVLVIRWRLARIPKTGARPGRAIWITLLLSPVPLFIFQNSVSSL